VTETRRQHGLFAARLEELQETRPGALGVRVLDDGRQLTLYPMLFGNTRLCLGWPSFGTYDAGWCYHDTAASLAALQTWDGDGDPPGYFKRVGE
jgi:hypothetical protein